jgi:hypothetical protein
MTSTPRIIERTWWTAYVRIYDIHRWTALGWEETGELKGTGHGDYSELMKWTGPGEPVLPEREEG